MAPSDTSFANLIAPLAPADVLMLWRGREPRFQPRTGKGRFSPPCNWNMLWDLIRQGVIPRRRVQVSYHRRTVHPKFYSDGEKLSVERLAQIWAQDFSLIVRQVHRYVPGLRTLREDATNHGIGIRSVNLFVTRGGGGALKIHYDGYDLIVLHVEGNKRWRIYGPRVLNPVVGMDPNDQPPKTTPLFDIVLGRGDILFLPAGFWHECDNESDNESDRSLHIAFVINSPTA